MKAKKIITVLLALSLIFTAGCGSKNKSGKEVDVTQEKYGTTYPLKTDKKLTVWADYALDPEYKNFEDQPLYKELEKRTGVEVEWITPTGDAKEQFNLLIASGNYPDIIIYSWYDCMGSPNKALNEKVIIPLNDVMKAYAPDAQKMMDGHEQSKAYVSDNGTYYGFPSFVEDDTQMMYTGPIIRADFLEKYGLEVPETLEEWDNVLRTFKANGVASPLVIRGKTLASDLSNTFVFGAFNTCYKFYKNDEGKITYGPIEPGFKEAVEYLRGWYEDGILDAEFASIDDAMIEKKITQGKSGACIQYVSRIAKWNNASDGTAKFIGAPYPTDQKGKLAEFGQLGTQGTGKYAAITTHCEDVELAAKWLNYGYTEEGKNLFNYGIEGETYNMVDGVAQFTEEYLNDFDRLNPYTCLYCSMHEVNRFNQRNRLPLQQEAIEKWKTNMAAHLIPAITPTDEENEETVSVINDISTYVDEMVLKFIVGYESMDNYDKFVETIKEKGIDKVLAVKQNQLDRFNSR